MTLFLFVVTAFGTSAVLCALFAKLAPSLGLMDVPNDPRKIHLCSTPRVGGLAILGSITFTYLLFREPIPWIIYGSIASMAVVGLIDDVFSLPAFIKLTFQGIVAFLLWHFGTRITLFIPSPFISLILTIFWFLLITNALNFMDNSNGLCGGVGLIILIGLIIIHMVIRTGDSNSVGISVLILAASVLGFLFWNFPRGRIFLGDSGSHLIGAAIAVLLIKTTFVHAAEGQSHAAILAVPLLVLVPVYDLLQVTIRRLKLGQPIWQADKNHLAHLLMRKGCSQSGAVILLWFTTLVAVFSAIVLWRSLL